MSNNLIKLRRKADALLGKNRLAEAKTVIREICRATPHDADAWVNLGVVEGRLGEFRQAETAFRRALEINPHLSQAYFNLGRLLEQRGRLREAEACWRLYVGIMPADPEGKYQLANVLKDIERFDDALPFYREVLRSNPNAVEVLLDYGETLMYTGRFEEAEAAYRQAIALVPDNAAAYLKLARIYMVTHQFERSAQALQRVAEIDPGMQATVLQQAATAAIWQGKFTEALNHFDAALALQSDNIALRWERSMHLLRLGRYHEGWCDYELRSRYWKWSDAMRGYQFDRPRWDGAPLAGRTILIYAEQGFGDNIQFSRYLPMVAERGGKVVFYCQKELLKLFRRIKGVERVEPRSERVKEERFDLHIPIMSLPFVFDTRSDSIPAPIPYLSADEHAVARWRARMDTQQFKVGLVWAGHVTNSDNYWRSLSVRDLAPLAGVDRVTFYSLRVGGAVSEFAELAELLDITDLSAELHDFDETAAVVANLDLVISVDTAVAHLAGALGRPTWTLLHFPSEWRWLTDREDSPWYPTMRLFRCAPGEGWSAVMRRVASQLREMAAPAGE